MKVAEIMNRAPLSLRDDETFGSAFERLRDAQVTTIPVVDADGVYEGIFDLKDIWRLLLPRAAHLNRNSIEDLSFVSSSLDRMKDEISEAAPLPIRQFLTADDLPVVYADSPVQQAILLIDKYGETVAVVDRQTRKLVGTVSAWQILDALR